MVASVKKRCGVCSACIDRELSVLSMAEEIIWADSEGDVTAYLNRMGQWIDLLIAEGIAL